MSFNNNNSDYLLVNNCLYKIQQRWYQLVVTSNMKEKGFNPTNGSEVFVKNIPKIVTVEDLLKFFQSAGRVFQMRIMMDPSGKTTRGFCYVIFFNTKDAKTALETLKVKEFRHNYRLSLEMSLNNCRIFIGGILTYKTKDQVWQELIQKGARNITDVIMYRSYTRRAENRGFVFVEFKTHEEAAYFRCKYNKMTLFGHHVIVDWSVPIPTVEEDIMEQVKILFIRNLDVTLQKEDLEAMLQYHIQKEFITKVYKFKNYAFVHLTSRSAAETLLKKLEDFYRDSGVEVTWAKPQNKFTSPEYRQNKVASSVHKSPRLRTTSCSSSVGSTSCTSSQEYIPRARCVSVPPSMNCKMVGLSNSYYPTTSLNPILLPSTSYASTSQQCTPQVRSSIFNWEWDNTLNAPSLVDDSFRNLIPFNEAQPFYNVNDLLGIADLDTQVNSQTRDTVLQILKNLDISGL